jgi:hypothetical protein
MTTHSRPHSAQLDLEAAALDIYQRGDREFAAALYALSAPFLRGRVERFINVAGHGIDFPSMLDDCWSSTERAMIEVACTLWGREDIADARLSPVLYSMDGGNFRRVLTAMRLRRGELDA